MRFNVRVEDDGTTDGLVLTSGMAGNLFNVGVAFIAV
jgi:hypothetical protein